MNMLQKNWIFKICQLTSQQCVFVAEQYYSNKCSTRAKRTFANEYNLNKDIRTVSEVVSKCRANGSM